MQTGEKQRQNYLRGGTEGSDKVMWNAQPLGQDEAVGVKLTYLSKDGEEGYPGNLTSTVTYLLTNNDEVSIKYFVAADADTVVNLTHHSYFNPAGQGTFDILGHILMIDADKFTPVDEGLIRTGELCSVETTPMDFTTPTAIAAWIEQDYEQLVFGKGYDHN